MWECIEDEELDEYEIEGDLPDQCFFESEPNRSEYFWLEMSYWKYDKPTNQWETEETEWQKFLREERTNKSNWEN